MMIEEWRDIEGYEGLYQVSSLGRVKSLISGKILKANTNRYGYKVVALYCNNKRKTITVHRLVAEAFITNPNNLQQINHINEDKSDNRACNLEFATPKQNANHGTRNERISKSKRNNTYNTKTVIQYTLDGDFIKEWSSVREIQRVLGFSQGAISSCCRGEKHYKTYKNYMWKYKKIC